MILIFTPKYEDMIFLITHLGGFPMNGRLLSASEYEPNRAAGRKQAEDFGYIKAPCSLFKGSPDVIYSWGDDLIQGSGDEIYINEKEIEQFENVQALLTNESLDSVYVFSIGKRTTYIPKLLSYIKPSTASVFLAEIGNKSSFECGNEKIKVNKKTETKEIFDYLLNCDASKKILPGIACPDCGNAMHKEGDDYICDLCGVSLPSVVQGRSITENELKYILKYKKTPLISGFSSPFYGRIIFEDGTFIFSKDSEYRCPSCGKALSVLASSNEYICAECGFVLPSVIARHTLSKSEIKSLFATGKTDIIRSLSGYIILNENNGFTPEIIRK